MFENEDFDFENRIVTTSYTREDSDVDTSLRPKTLDDYIGQEKVVFLDVIKEHRQKLCR